MRKFLIPALAAIVAVVVVALPATAQNKDKEYDLIAALSGQEEAPDAGDPDGYGAADFRIKGNRVCFRIVAKNIAPVQAAHIHRGAPGEAGPAVVGLYASSAADSKLPPRIARCVKSTRALVKEIARFPTRFYVNVHNADFPNGALRGQLSR